MARTKAVKMNKKSTEPTKFERTGQNTFAVRHEDGSVYHGEIDPSKVQFKKDSLGDAGGNTKVFQMGSPCNTCGSKWHRKCK